MLMFLKGPLLKAVQSGRKTQTLRKQRLRLNPGHVISFNGRCRVIVETLDYVAPRDLDVSDAQREGFDSLADLNDVLRDLDLLEQTQLTRIRFRLQESG